MKIPFERIRKEGAYLPSWFYGSAYTDYAEAYQIFYPIPFNYLVRCFREIKYFWNHFRSQSTWIDQQVGKLREEMWMEYYVSLTPRQKILRSYQELRFEDLLELSRLVMIEEYEAQIENVHV